MSPLPKQLVAGLSEHLHLTYVSRNGLTKGLKRKGGLGFIPSKAADRDREVQFLRSLDLRDKVVFDVGAFHGLMTIFFAQQARQVISYEANPENIIRIYDNARVNHLRNVIIRNVAISDVEGLLTLCVAPLHSGEASGNAEIAASILKSRSTVEQFSVAMTTIDEDVRRHGIAAPDLVKIDIEGMELQALRGMRNTLTLKKPDLYIELHGTTPDHKRTNGAAVMDLLWGAGYNVLNVEENINIAPGRQGGRESHIYCSAKDADTKDAENTPLM